MSTVIIRSQPPVIRAIRKGIVRASVWIASICTAIAALVMTLEAALRYISGNPLGWNISLIESFLLPAIVFLGLPWAYHEGAHVRAELVYDRLGPRLRKFCRGLSDTVMVLGSVFLICAGVAAAYYFFEIGAKPPPLSSAVPIPTWITYSLMPLGVAASLVVALIDVVFGADPDSEPHVDRVAVPSDANEVI